MRVMRRKMEKGMRWRRRRGLLLGWRCRLWLEGRMGLYRLAVGGVESWRVFDGDAYIRYGGELVVASLQ